ncbi:MAG: alkaline phosphatase family protein [Acidobacteriia bacterium]|nr:alkaline phosphatase family protein [Terriglobia bacterium]
MLLISIDGMHAVDLANFVKAEPDSTLAKLTAAGITYTQAAIAKPSNSIVGLLAMVTGGSPNSTGIWYEGSYSRSLSPPGSNCETRGTPVVWGSTLDKDRKAIDGGGIDPAKLPRDPAKGCAPVYPHNFLRVNTIFEVAHEAGMRTAWTDKHPAYDEMLTGPSGKGLDDLFTPEVAATSAAHNLQAAEAYDDLKVQAVLNLIAGKDHAGLKTQATPALFGAALQYISFAQKLPDGGYVDAIGTPSANLAKAFQHIDEAIGKLVAALKARGLMETTLLIVTSRHGDSPMERTRRRIIPDTILPKIIQQAHGDVLALAYQDGDIASIWLKDQSKTNEVTKTLSTPENEAALDTYQILSGESLKVMFNDPLRDERIPDIVLIPNLGGIFTEADSEFIAEHGGFNDDDTSVPLLIAGPRLSARVVRTPVQMTQVAPTILKALGLNPDALQAVKQEKTTVLPVLFESLAASNK